MFFVTSRFLPEVKCVPYRQPNYHHLQAEEVYERPEEDIEALIRARQLQHQHLAAAISHIPYNDGGRSPLISEKTPTKFRSTLVKPQPALKPDSDFSFDAVSSRNDEEIPIDATKEQLHPGPPGASPPRSPPALLLQKPGIRSAEVFSVKVQPPEVPDANYREEATGDEDEEEEDNKQQEYPAEKQPQQNAPSDDVIKQDHVMVASDVIDSDAPIVAAALCKDDVRAREHNRDESSGSLADVYLLAVMAGCAVAAVSGLTLAGVCWYRLHKKVKAASDVEYPAYGVTGPAKDHTGGSPGDRKLAQSAQMYHYQHQKQQMIASERRGSDVNGHGGGEGGSEGESEEECEEGDYTVFECPGLATAGEMEVRNPLFNEQTPVATPAEK